MLSTIIGFVIAITGVIAGIFALLADELNKNKQLKYILVAVLLALSFYAMLGSLLSLSTTDKPITETSKLNVPIAIDSTKDWQNSGIYMSKGDTVVVRVVGGTWTPSRRKMTESEASQLPENIRNNEIWVDDMLENWGTGSLIFRCADIDIYDCPLPTENFGALIGKIGTSEPFLIGSENKIIASADGWLFFRINDSIKKLDDNHGILAVEIIK